MTRRNATRHLLLALAAATILRIVAVAIYIDPHQAPDSESFVLLTESILEDGRMAYRDNGSPEVELRAFRSLFYPVFLAAMKWAHLGTTGALVLQALLGLAVVLCMFLLGRLILGEKFAVVTAWIGALYFSSVTFERQILSESLYAPILIIGCTLAIFAFQERDRYGRRDYLLALCGGVVLGLAAITRPVGLVAAGFVAGVAFLLALKQMRLGGNRGVLALVGLFVLGTSVVVGPAIVRNTLVLGKPALSTSGGMNFWMGNHVGTMGDAWRIMGAEVAQRGEIGMDKWFYADTWNHRADILAGLPKLLAQKSWGFFAPVTRELKGLPHRLIFPLALIGLLLARPQRWRPWLLVWSVMVAHIALGLMFVADPRYRSPIDPFTWLLAGAGIVLLWQKGMIGRTTIVALAGLNIAVRLFLQ